MNKVVFIVWFYDGCVLLIILIIELEMYSSYVVFMLGDLCLVLEEEV